jgi:hypothetical protein
MGILAAMGLHLGETLPPGPDNPKGYFESSAVARANVELLGRLDRDWTNPPHRLPAVDGGEAFQQAL